MIENFRRFETGPDPFGKVWQVEFEWLQTAIAIRHSDSVDVKFSISNSETREEKVVSLPHPVLLDLAAKAGRAVTDPWCMKLAALHLKRAVETGDDIEKTILTPSPASLEECHQALG